MRPENASSGYALVIVLIAISLLSLVLESALVISKMCAQNTSLDLIKLRLDSAAAAGVNEGILNLLDPQPASRWPTNGLSRHIRFDDIGVTITLEDEFGKIDLNGANRQLIFGLFSAAGMDDTSADALTDRVLDWREPSPIKRLHGAKENDYCAAGLPYRPREGPFQTKNELELILGMTPNLYKKLEPGITVYNTEPLPDIQDAPPIVLRALGLSAAAIEVILSTRAKKEFNPISGDAGASAIIGLPNTVFTITATASGWGATATQSETLRFTGNPKRPYWTLASF